MARHNVIGTLGENIALRYFYNHGYTLHEKNVSCKYGELDLILKYNKTLHFVEVKSTSLHRKQQMYPDPIERVDHKKLLHIKNSIISWAQKNTFSLEKQDWQCDICIVYIDQKNKKAEVDCIPNIVFP